MGQDLRPFAFALAAWRRYCCGTTDNGDAYALRDPRESEIRSALEGARRGIDISDRLHALPNLIVPALSRNSRWRKEVASALDAMLRLGVSAAARAAFAA